MPETVAQIDVAETMRRKLPYFREGVGGIRLSGLKPECETDWNERYAIVDGLYYSRGDFDEIEYFDDDKFQADVEDMVRREFPGCNVRFYWRSQEIEVERK